jgi:hypothetical protein
MAVQLNLFGKFAYAHDEISNSQANIAFATIGGIGGAAPFTVFGARPSRDLALTTAGAEWRLANGVSFLVKFDGKFGDRSETYSGTGRIRYSWRTEAGSSVSVTERQNRRPPCGYRFSLAAGRASGTRRRPAAPALHRVSNFRHASTKTSAPVTMSASAVFSVQWCVIPPIEGTNSMPAGMTVARIWAS